MSQRERIGGKNVFCLKELHGEVVGARHREAKGQLAVDGGLGQQAVLEVVRAVQRVVGDHIGDLAIGAVGVDPAGNGLDLRQILAVIDQVINGGKIAGALLRRSREKSAADEKIRQSHSGQGGAAHRGGKGDGEQPEADLQVPAAVHALCQGCGADQEQEEPAG